MKDIYFYQNHHYSHILLTVYQVLIEELTKRLEDSDNNDLEGDKNKENDFFYRLRIKQQYANQ